MATRNAHRRIARNDVVFRTASGAMIVAAGPARRDLTGPVATLVRTGAQRLTTALVAFPLAVAGAVGPRPLGTWARDARRTVQAGGQPLAQLLAFALAVPATLLFLVRGLAYPLVAQDTSLAWGGPTLLGAWAVQALVGLLLVAGTAALVSPLVRPRPQPRAR